ncbi:hypothetical protein FRB94_011197 [Tulasnella sp. JGI-2019a]|nr:hypothetical protein FRB94_011197 [Tulasnella sp. JGI-2019a]
MLGRFATDFYAMYRTLFITGGEPAKLGTTDHILRGFEHLLTFIAGITADSLFCWRLYVIWSRNVRIILLPAFLLVSNFIVYTIVVVTDFLTAHRPKDPRYNAINKATLLWGLSIIIVHTTYITLFIIGRLWWVGRAANRNKIMSPEEVKRNRYYGAINALAQSGAIYLVAMLLAIISMTSTNFIFKAVIRNVDALASSIATTLLFLQLNLFQGEVRHGDAPPMTSPTFKFATRQGTSLSGEIESSPTSEIRRRRASMPTYPHRDSGRDVTCLPLAALPQPGAENQSQTNGRAGTSCLDVEQLHKDRESTATIV